MSAARLAAAAVASPLAAGSGLGLAISIFLISPREFDSNALALGLGMSSFGVFLALPHMLIAVPVFLALRRRGLVNWGSASVAGIVIGLVPWIVLLVVTGSDLLASWSAWLIPAGGGLAGGLTFRAVLGRHAAEAT